MAEAVEIPFDLARIDMDGQSTLVVYGELDIMSSPKLHEALSSIIGEGPRTVLVDLANVTFIDSSGLGALVAAERRLRASGERLRVVAASTQTAKVIGMTGLSDRFDLHVETE